MLLCFLLKTTCDCQVRGFDLYITPAESSVRFQCFGEEWRRKEVPPSKVGLFGFFFSPAKRQTGEWVGVIWFWTKMLLSQWILA